MMSDQTGIPGSGQTPPMGNQPLQPPMMQQQIGAKKQTSGMAIASLVMAVLALACFGIVFGPLAVIFGLVALKQIKTSSGRLGGDGLAIAGIAVGAVGFVIYLGIFALIAIPNFQMLRAKAYDASAQSAAIQVKFAEELHFQSSGGESGGSYTDNLNNLLHFEKGIIDDPDVTFIFGSCNAEGYTFTTQHAKGNEAVVYTE